MKKLKELLESLKQSAKALLARVSVSLGLVKPSNAADKTHDCQEHNCGMEFESLPEDMFAHSQYVEDSYALEEASGPNQASDDMSVKPKKTKAKKKLTKKKKTTKKPKKKK
jgi:hypothetical protein